VYLPHEGAIITTLKGNDAAPSVAETIIRKREKKTFPGTPGKLRKEKGRGMERGAHSMYSYHYPRCEQREG